MEDKENFVDLGEVELSEDDMFEYLFEELVEEGYAPSEEEVEMIASLMYDYIISALFLGRE